LAFIAIPDLYIYIEFNTSNKLIKTSEKLCLNPLDPLDNIPPYDTSRYECRSKGYNGELQGWQNIHLRSWNGFGQDTKIEQNRKL